MGQENKYFKVGGLRFLQALTPRECYSRFIVARPSEPLSRLGKGGGGKGQMPPQATYGAYLCAVRIDFRLPSKINPYPAQQGAGKGFVKGETVPLDPLLVPFGGAKGTPRRRAVLTWLCKRSAPPEARRSSVTSICRKAKPRRGGGVGVGFMGDQSSFSISCLRRAPVVASNLKLYSNLPALNSTS